MGRSQRNSFSFVLYSFVFAMIALPLLAKAIVAIFWPHFTQADASVLP